MVFVRRDLVVHEGVVVTDVPQGHHEIALDAFRPGRRRRHFALVDALGPIGKGPRCPGQSHIDERTVHRIATHSGTEAPLPGLLVRRDVALRLEDVIDAAREPVSELMTEIAVRFQRVDPVVLGLHVRAQAVAVRPGARKLLLRRRLEQRQPVIARIHLCRFLWSLRRRRLERDRRRARLHLNRRRIREAVASHPHAVTGGWQVRQREPPLVISDDDLDEVRGQPFRLGDHPHAGFGSRAALNDTSDEAVCRWCIWCAPLSLQRTEGKRGERGDHRRESDATSDRHATLR